MLYPKPVFTIKSLEDAFLFLERFVKEGTNYIYRGVSNESYGLVPSVGRINKPSGLHFSKRDEKKLLDLFKKRAYPFIKEHINDELTLLTIGQHHGLPTRLLDWTVNPLIALYFAVENEIEVGTASCVYVLDIKSDKIKKQTQIKPFDIDKVERFIPSHWDQRIIAQGGQFTLHPNPHIPWGGEGRLQRVFVIKQVRKKVKGLLDKFGVNAGTVYPEIDGIAKYVRWEETNEH